MPAIIASDKNISMTSMRRAILFLFYLFMNNLQGIDKFNCDFLYKKKSKYRGIITNTHSGQLGNSLFRSAAAISLAYDHNMSFIVNKKYKDEYPEVYRNIPYRSNKLLERKALRGCKTINLPNVWKNKVRIDKHRSYSITGHPHDFAYFAHNADLIRKIFGPSKEKKQYLKNKYRYIFDDKNAVGIHVRTFFLDYGNGGLNSEFNFWWDHWTKAHNIKADFYKRAIELFPVDTVFYVISDKIDISEEWFKVARTKDPAFDRRFVFIKDSSIVDDFYLLSMMDRLIISHSTFACFAAFLNPNSEKVVVWGMRHNVWGNEGIPLNCHPSCLGEKPWIKISDYRKNTPLDDKWHQIMSEYVKRNKSNKG